MCGNGTVTGDAWSLQFLLSLIVMLQGEKEGLSHQFSNLCLTLEPVVSTQEFKQLRAEK